MDQKEEKPLTPKQLSWVLKTALTLLNNCNKDNITDEMLSQLADVCREYVKKLDNNSCCRMIFLYVQECIQLEYERQLSCTTQIEK